MGTSESGRGTTIGNASGSDIQSATMTDVKTSQQAQLAAAKEEDNSITMDTVNENIVKIYSLLQNVVDGTASFTTRTLLTTSPMG